MAPDSRRWLSRGTLSPSLFRLPIELGQAQHRHLQLAGHALQPPGDPGHLLLPGVVRIVGLDQLQIVDHDQARACASASSRRATAAISVTRAAGAVVDEQRRLREHGGRFDQSSCDRRPCARPLRSRCESTRPTSRASGRPIRSPTFPGCKQRRALSIRWQHTRQYSAQAPFCPCWAGRRG